VELWLLRLGEHVEAETEVGLVSEAVHPGRVAVDRQLERGLDLEAEYFRASVLRSTTARRLSESQWFRLDPGPTFWKRDASGRVDVPCLQTLATFMHEKLRWLDGPVTSTRWSILPK
jgi:hypothetical protein